MAAAADGDGSLIVPKDSKDEIGANLEKIKSEITGGASGPRVGGSVGNESADAVELSEIRRRLIESKRTQDAAKKAQSRNWLIHQLYVRKEWNTALSVIGEVVEDTDGKAAFAQHTKGLILRGQGKVVAALAAFEAAVKLEPTSAASMKQVGRTLYFLGKIDRALAVYAEAAVLAGAMPDWELAHARGVALQAKGAYDEALEAYQEANRIQPHDPTYLALGKLYIDLERYQEAIDVFNEALDFSPQNPKVLKTLGLLYLRLGDNAEAFDYLGNALTYDPRDSTALLAAGSIIQDNGDVDVALAKYRIAAASIPASPQLWNNIGMCFFGKGMHVAALACLKKAQGFAPFEWLIAYNLGLVHLATDQFASAFHYFSAAINLKPDWPASYGQLAVTLVALEDYSNAWAAYDRAISLAPDDPSILLNYAISLARTDQKGRAKKQLAAFAAVWSNLDEAAQADEPDLAAAYAKLSKELGQE